MNFTFCFRKYRFCEKYVYKEVKITHRPGKAIACECSRKEHLLINKFRSAHTVKRPHQGGGGGGGGGGLISRIPVIFGPNIPYPINSGYKYSGN